MTRTYHLYSRCATGREPKVQSMGRSFPRFGSNRGVLIRSFSTYNALTVHVHSLCVKIGIPKSRAWDIFDWNKTA